MIHKIGLIIIFLAMLGTAVYLAVGGAWFFPLCLFIMSAALWLITYGSF